MFAGRTFVLVDERIEPDANGKVPIAGYFTLTVTAVELTDLPDSARRVVPKYSEVGAILLGRLARHSDYRGQGLGKRLMSEAFMRIYYLVRNTIGAPVVVVDPIDEEAERFYSSYGFARLANTPGRLFLPTQDVVATLQTLGVIK